MTATPLELLAALRRHRWIDLTHAFAPGIPHYHAFPDERRRVLFGIEEGVGELGHGFLVHEYRHVGQWGTHVDPPSHFVAGGRELDAIPVTEMVLPLVVLDLRAEAAADPDLVVGAEHVLEHEAQHGRIPDGAFVAADFGWSARWPDPERMANRDGDGAAHYPGWGVAAIDLLVGERAVTAIGHDTTDTDPGVLVSAGQVPAETAILAADRWQIELLANLDEVPPRGAIVVASWPKPAGGSGFPARVWAVTPGD